MRQGRMMGQESKGRNGWSVLAVDPGETTGLAWCGLGHVFGPVMDGKVEVRKGETEDERYARLFDWAQIGGNIGEQTGKIVRGIIRLNVRVIVVEQSDHFLLRAHPGALRKSSLVPVKLVGALEGLCGALGERGPLLVQQTPAQAKPMITDARLAGLGFPVKTGGQDGRRLAGSEGKHAKDALRHLLLFLRRCRAGGPFTETVARELAMRDTAWMVSEGGAEGMGGV